MTALKSRLIRVFKSRKINVFFLFVLLAFIILILTKLSKEYTNTIVLNVNPEQTPEEVVVLNDSTHQLKVTLTTYGFKWLSLYLNTPSLSINFSEDVDKTERFFIWNNAKGFSSINNQFGNATKINSINPDTLKFRYDTNTIKYVPVKVNAKLTFSPGYNILKSIKVTPDSIKVIGPKTILSALKTIETESISLKNVKTTISQTLVLKTQAIDRNVKLDFEKVQIDAEVSRFTEGTLSIPVQVINVPKNTILKHFPKNINVSYYTSLKTFKDITVNSFKVVCDYKAIKPESTYLVPVLIERPETVKSARLHQQKIEFIITQ